MVTLTDIKRALLSLAGGDQAAAYTLAKALANDLKPPPSWRLTKGRRKAIEAMEPGKPYDAATLADLMGPGFFAADVRQLLANGEGKCFDRHPTVKGGWLVREEGKRRLED